MTNRRTELLAAVHATDDDQAKLVYADWLEEQGDTARALLIRRQCEAAAAPAWDALEARWEVAALLAEHGDAWRAELPELPDITWLDFERGFPSRVGAQTPAALYAASAKIAKSAPAVHTAEIHTLDERNTEVPDGGVPWLRALRIVQFQNLHIHPTRTLLDLVTELELGVVWWESVARVLAERNDMPLHRLVIGDEHPIGGLVATRLAELTGARELRELRVGTTFIDHQTGYYEDPTLRAEGASTLADIGLAELEVLDVARQLIGSDGLAALLAALPKLRELDASGCEIAGLQALYFPGAELVRLDLSRNNLRDQGANAIATAPRCARLQALVLDTCELGAAGVEELARSPAWQTLRVLDLSRNPLGAAGAEVLASAPPPPHLHTLKLADCDFDDGAARLLASCEWLGRLLVVDLAKNQVATELVRGLANARVLGLAGAVLQGEREGMLDAIWPHAVELDLAGLTLGGLISDAAPALQALSLTGCAVQLPWLQHLTSPAFPRLRRLSLAGCDLPLDAVVDHLVAHGAGAITELDLRRIQLEPGHVVALARALAPRVKLKMHGRPWTYPPEIRAELANRIGQHWYHHDDDPDQDEDE